MAGVIHHSDHGSQYTSYAFSRRLVDTGITASLGSIGDSFDNAMAESWFATIKIELLYRRIWRTRHEAQAGDLPLDRGLVQPTPHPGQAWAGAAPWNTKPPTRPAKTCRSPLRPRMPRSSARSSKRRLTAPAGRSRLEKAEPTRRMDHEKGSNDPGTQLIPASNKPGKVIKTGLSGHGWGSNHHQRAPRTVDQMMNLAGQPSPRAANAVVRRLEDADSCNSTQPPVWRVRFVAC